jgi:hypothetical protein
VSIAFTLCLLTLFLLAAIGMPIAHATIVGSIVYLADKGQDLGIAGEQIIYCVYDSFVLLAVPLFIVAANLMNAGSISERLLRFCVALVGRFKGGMGHVNIVSSLIFSGVHHLGSMGEAFTLGAFAFRFFAGVVFAALYQARGFALAAWTHALYDIWVMVFLGVK